MSKQFAVAVSIIYYSHFDDEGGEISNLKIWNR